MPEVIKIEDCDKLAPISKYKYAKWDFDQFNPVQTRLLETYSGDSNIAIAAATSAGKTVCAEMYMAYETRHRGGKAAYIGPLKALASEKEQDWTDDGHHFHDMDVAIVTGDFRMTPQRIKELDKSDIIVMTPEMLASRCRNHKSEKSTFLKDVGTIVFDESHLLTVPGRGDHIEVALMKMAEINPDVRIVLLSATMPNVHEICGWTCNLTGRDTYFLESDYRPCPLNVHYEEYYDGDRSYDAKEMQKVATACAIVEYYEDDKFLIFVHTKRTGQLMVQTLGRYGVQAEFHNADLKFAERKKLEDKFKNDPSFRVIVATSTLAWGLNLPARRVIVTGVHRGLSIVENYDIRQMIGRAGRPRYDDRGDAYILVPESQKKETIDMLRKDTLIRSTLLEYVGTEKSPHYKTLAFHIVSEIHQGSIKTPEGFKQWFNRSLAHYQDIGFNEEILEKTIQLLEQYRAIKIEDGEYKTTIVGTIASMYYYSPFDVSDLKRNFYHLFDKNQQKDDFAIAMALGAVDSNRWAICNRYEKEQMATFQGKINRMFGEYTHHDGSVKHGYAYFNMLKGKRNVPAFQALQTGLMFDLDRTMQVLYSLDAMGNKGDNKEWLKTLRLRLQYGVGPELVQVCQIPNVGAVRGERLRKSGIKNAEDMLKHSAAHLAGIMKCSKKLAEEARKGAEEIVLKESISV